jgi:hypothetical protein
MKSFATVAAFVTGLLASSAIAHAGTGSGYLLGVTGKVLINAGKGFQTAEPAVAVKSGYDVFVAEGASATIHFNEADCEVTLAAGSVTHVRGADMCQQATLKQTTVNALRGTETDVVITPVNGIYSAVPAPLAAGTISPYFIAGGIFVIGGAAFTSGYFESNPQPISGP